MIIKNPLKQDISIQLDGKTFSLKAEDKLSLESSLAERWQKIHSFLTLENEEAAETKEIKETKEVKEKKEVELTEEDEEIIAELDAELEKELEKKSKKTK